jgi:hypothetical protein
LKPRSRNTAGFIAKLKIRCTKLPVPADQIHVQAMRKQFSEAGKTRFGSGWAWLSIDNKGNLFIYSVPKQDNTLMDISEKMGVPYTNDECMGTCLLFKLSEQKTRLCRSLPEPCEPGRGYKKI